MSSHIYIKAWRSHFLEPNFKNDLHIIGNAKRYDAARDKKRDSEKKVSNPRCQSTATQRESIHLLDVDVVAYRITRKPTHDRREASLPGGGVPYSPEASRLRRSWPWWTNVVQWQMASSRRDASLLRV
jgi:hypothetical protein